MCLPFPHFTICVTVDCERELTCVFTPMLSILLMVSILVWLYLHQCDFIPALQRDFIPVQCDLPSLDYVSHYQQRDCVSLVSMIVLLILLKNMRYVYFYLNSLSQGMQFVYLDWLVPSVTRSNLELYEYKEDPNNGYDSLVLLSLGHYLFIFCKWHLVKHLNDQI